MALSRELKGAGRAKTRRLPAEAMAAIWCVEEGFQNRGPKHSGKGSRSEGPEKAGSERSWLVSKF